MRETELNELLTNAIINNCNSNKIYCVNCAAVAVATSSASRSQSWLPSQLPSHCSRCRRRRQRQRRGVFSYVVFFLCINNYDEETLRKTKLKQRRAMNEWPNEQGQSTKTKTTRIRTTTAATTMTGRQQQQQQQLQHWRHVCAASAASLIYFMSCCRACCCCCCLLLFLFFFFLFLLLLG